MNELRPCAPLSLRHVLAQEVIKGLQSVSDSLVRYNSIRSLRGNESTLFFSLCQAFLEVAYPYCATCFGRCYPNGATLITDHRNVLDGLSQLVAVSPARGLKTPANKTHRIDTTANGEAKLIDNGNADVGEVLEVASVDKTGPVESDTQISK